MPLNERQRLVIRRLLDGFEGKLTTSKWAALTKSSQDTALRDIQQLVERGVLVRNAAGGRSTSYRACSAAPRVAPQAPCYAKALVEEDMRLGVRARETSALMSGSIGDSARVKSPSRTASGAPSR